MSNSKVLFNNFNNLDSNELTALVNDLAVLSKASAALRKRLIKILPTEYGSELWWEKGELEVDEELKNKKYKKFSSMSDAINYLKKL